MKNFFLNHAMIARYIISGATGAGVQFLAFYLFAELFGVWYIWAVFLAFLVTLSVTFCMQKFWTFRSFSQAEFKREFAGYTLVAVGGALLNVFLMRLLVDSFGADPVLAQAMVIIAITPISYLVNKKLVFVLYM